MTSTTRAIVSISSNSTSSTEARIVVVRSVIGSIFTPGGMEASICGSSSRILFTTLIMLDPGWR